MAEVSGAPAERAASILAVDDSRDGLRLLARLLSEQGFQVRPVLDGAAALAAAALEVPDLVLLDLQMPGMDGLMTIRHIRTHADPVVASTRIIAVTALAMAGDRERCLAAGANEYISKPVNLKELKQMIESQLGKL
mgnify:CR=1 FL=1